MLRAFFQRPWLLAIILSVALLLWLVTGNWFKASEQAPADQPPAQQNALAQVQFEWREAKPMQRQHLVQGQLEAWRRVDLRAQINASVVALDRDKGSSVTAGDVLLTLSGDSRPAELARDEADVRQQEAAAAAARRLYGQKLLSNNDLLKVESELASARARLDATRLALSRTRIRAPFDGVYDERRVELGDYVEPGQSLLSVVEIGRLKVSAQIPQQDVARLAIGQPVRVQLLDGAQLNGTLHFIAAAAEPGTRSFRIEVTAANPEHLRLAGASATLLIDTGEALAHAVSPALLSLDKEGRPGIKWLNEQQVVQFTPVQLISVSNQTAWVAGLPKRVALITAGQGFVEAGQQVVARQAGQVN